MLLTKPEIYGTKEEWLDVRTTGIGSSEISMILGTSPFKRPTDVWLTKTGRAGWLFPDSMAMEWGRILEPLISDYYQRNHKDCKIVNPGAYTIFRHPKYPLIFATPDRLVNRGEKEWGLEIKTTNDHFRKHWGKPGTADIPLYYLYQVMMCMAVTGFERWDVAVLFGGQDYQEYTVYRDLELEEELIQKVLKWWDDYVKSDAAPPADGGDNYSQYLLNLYGNNNESFIPADGDVDKFADRLASLNSVIKRSKDEADRLKQELKIKIGEARGIRGRDYKISWSRFTKEKTDWKGLAEELNPSNELIEKYTISSPGEMLTPSGRLFDAEIDVE